MDRDRAIMNSDMYSDMDSIVEKDNFPSMVVRENIILDHHYNKGATAVFESNGQHTTASKEQRLPLFEIESFSNINLNATRKTLCEELDHVDECELLFETSGEEAQDAIVETENILPWIIDDEGDTPIHLAIICRYTSSLVIALWIKLLAIVPDFDILDHQNNQRQTPLHLAVLAKCYSTVQLLVDLEANPQLQDNKLRTAAHIACEQRDSKSLSLLCRSRVESPSDWISIYDGLGQTCLHIAVSYGDRELVEILLDHGADINARDRKSGRTALHLAVEAGDIDMIKCLLLYPGLRVDAQTFSGASPMQLAYGRTDMHRASDVIEFLRRNCSIDDSYTFSDDDDDGEGASDDDSDKVNE